MVVVRDPFDLFEEFFKSFRKLIDELERDFERTYRLPAFGKGFGFGGYEVEERPEGYLFKISMPGVDKNSIDLRVDDEKRVIVVEAKSNQEKKEENEFMQFSYNYYFEIPLPEDADLENIMAKYKDGALLVFVGRKEKPKGRRINIE